MNNISRIEQIVFSDGLVKDKLGISDEVVKIYDILRQFIDDEDTKVACVLQNSINANYNYKLLAHDFGAKVAEIVTDVSSYVHHGHTADKWKIKNNYFLKKIEIFKPEPLVICTAYETHRLDSLLKKHQVEGDKVLQSIDAPIHRQLKYYCRFSEILNKRQHEFKNGYEKVFNYDLVKNLAHVRCHARDIFGVQELVGCIYNLSPSRH